MNDSRDEISLALARARQRFPGYSVDIAYPVCWPVYAVRLTLKVLAEQELLTVARYILQLSSLGVAQPAEFGRLLGLSEDYIAGAAAELLKFELAIQGPDRGLEVTEKGKQTLNDRGRHWHPRREHITVPYDPLSRRVTDTSIDDLLYLDSVQKNGLFVVPAVGDKPRLSELRIDEIKEFARYEDQIDPANILEIAEIRAADARLRYRNGLTVVKMDVPNSNQSAFAVYRGREYLEEETTAMQRLADSGHTVAPEEYVSIASEPWTQLSSVTHVESELLTAIQEDDRAVEEAERAIVEAREKQRDTQDERERIALEKRIAELEAEKSDLSNRLAESEKRLDVQTGGAFRLVKAEEHRPLLLEAIDKATTELTLVSAWIGSEALDNEVCRRLRGAMERGVEVRIAWGLGTRRRGPEADRNIKRGEEALSRLKRNISGTLLEKLAVKRVETHEKFIICDDKFCAWGSLNWLSYRGVGIRRETSSYSERSDEIAQWKANAETLFR